MSELGSLSGSPKTYKIGNLELNFKPRTLADADLIFDMSDEKKKGVALRELITRTLKDAVPDATAQEIDSVAFKYFKEIAEAVIDVNGLKQ